MAQTRLEDPPRPGPAPTGAAPPPAAPDSNPAPGPAQGAPWVQRPWFDLVTRLALLVLGVYHLAQGLIAVSPAVLLTLLLGYGLIAVLSALDLHPATRALLRRRGLRLHTPNREYLIVNFGLDSAFIVGLALVGTDPDPAPLMFMATLAGLRLLAALPPDRRSEPPALLALPFGLPLLLLAERGLALWTGYPLGAAPLLTLGIAVLLTEILLLMLYGLLRLLNLGLGQAAELRLTVARRDQQIAQAESAILQESRRRADQLQRLQALQDGIRAVNSAMELPDLLQLIVNNAVRVMQGEQATIGLLDPDAGPATGELIIQAATGIDARALRRRSFPPGVGIAGWVVQHGEPALIDDVELDSRYIDPPTPGYRARTTRSMLCVPLRVEHRVIGTLSVTHSQPNALNRDDEALLLSFAGQAALAVHKTRLLAERTRQSDELRRRGDLIASLMTIRHAVLSSLDLPEVLHTTISRLRELIPFDQGRIILLDPRTGEPQVSDTHGAIIGDPTALHLGAGSPLRPLWEQARQTGQPQIITTADPAGAAETPNAKRQTPNSYLILPLINRGQTLGGILLARPVGAASFSPAEREIAEQLAGTATIAVDNARLFSSLAQQQQQTAALYRLMLQVSDAPNRRQLAHVICQELAAITGAPASALLIHDAELGRLSGWAAAGAWESRRAIQQIILPGHGDPYIGQILTQLQTREPGDLLILPGLPPQAAALLTAIDTTEPQTSNLKPQTSYITIPLTLAGRIYGLLLLQPAGEPAIPDELKETVSLAISHCTVALERTELFEQTLAAARQSSMLHSIASEVQGSLDPAMVLHTAGQGALMALPVYSCEVYVFEGDRKLLHQREQAVSRSAEGGGWRPGPATIDLPTSPAALEALYAPSLVGSDLDGAAAPPGGPTVLVGRLLGSEEVLGLVRLTTWLPAEEFIRHHGTFCQTLWVHTGGALERSRLYTTAATQARQLRQRAQQLTDILNLGSITAADVPLSTLLPRIAAGIARSLGFSTVQIGVFDPDMPNGHQPPTAAWPPAAGSAAPPLTSDELTRRLAAGRPVAPGFKGVLLNATSAPAAPPLLLMPLESTAGGALGYVLAAAPTAGDAAAAPTPALDHELLEVLSIFAQQTALMMENHQIYSQLLNNKRKIEGVVLSISDGVIVTDEELNILTTNSLADQLLNAETEASQGVPIRHFIDNAGLINQLEECLATGTSTPIDVDLTLGREQRTYQAIVHPIAGDPLGAAGSLGVVLTLRDVTLERATERAKSDFLSIVSHEMRTPLNSIMGFMDIILMGKTGPLNELQTDFLGTAKQESVALQRLIDDVLDYSQIQSRMLRMVAVPIDLSGVVARVANQAVPRMAEDELRLINTVPPQILVMGDEVRLAQVFKNLLDNAAKFTDPGGEIRFDADLTTETITISVKDNGCGIPPAQVGGVFDRFFQAENSSTRRKRGLGLGLAICKSIVEAHEGHIWIESELGVGTTVFVQLRLFRPDKDLANIDLDSGRAIIKAWG